MTELNDYAMTHGGKFHADDVFSAALLKIINPNIKIIRTFEVPDDFEGLVFDIGGGKFDHHQEDSPNRENGMPYAAFGLLWKEFGKNLLCKAGCTPEQAEAEALRLDEKFIQPLDEDDNTGCGNQLAGIIGLFNPTWDSNENSDVCFEQAVKIADIILNKKIDSIVSAQRAKILVEEALKKSDGKIVILPQFAPWKHVLVPSDAQFVVYPSQRGGYNAQVIPMDLDTKESKCDFPEEWAGKTEEQLPLISGVETLTFCHKGRFLISVKNIKDAVKACEIALKQKEAAETEVNEN